MSFKILKKCKKRYHKLPNKQLVKNECKSVCKIIKISLKYIEQ